MSNANNHIRVLQRELAARDSREKLLSFIKFDMYDPEDPSDVNRSLYQETPQARLLCDVMEKIDRKEIKRLCVSISPQTGKSQVLSRHGVAWLLARNPRLHIILATYNETMAQRFGGEVRDIMGSPAFKQVFPDFELVRGGEAKDFLQTKQGGRIRFVGVGGSTTGMRADVFIVDDPIKDDEDAQSASFREKLWNWFNSVVGTRIHKDTAIVVVHTRWHMDDLIGRLCDPEHPERNKKLRGISKSWPYLNIPAVVTEPELAKALGLTLEVPTEPDVIEMFGDRPMSSLWPDRQPLQMLAEQKRMDERVFNALRMGRPVMDNGYYFEKDWLVEYTPDELPKELKIYAASDHATSLKQQADNTVIGCIGVDANDDIWVLPDLVMKRMETDETVDEIIYQIKQHRPLVWWMEDESISKSFGPFLKKRMLDEKAYVTLTPVRPGTKDKMTRARSIQGRMQMKKVRFPSWAPWWREAKAQLLGFPFHAHDDFVDFLAHVGHGLLIQHGPTLSKKEDNVVEVGSIQWTLAQTRLRAAKDVRVEATKGW